jgi:hypothetical protein
VRRCADGYEIFIGCKNNLYPFSPVSPVLLSGCGGVLVVVRCYLINVPVAMRYSSDICADDYKDGYLTDT